MNRRIVTIIILIIMLAYGSWRVANGLVPLFQQDGLVTILLSLSPWLLFIVSLKSWHRCYTWRCMLAARNIEPILPRGGTHRRTTKSSPHILEYVCCALFVLSLAAILKQFSVPHSGWIIGTLFFSVGFLRILLKKI